MYRTLRNISIHIKFKHRLSYNLYFQLTAAIICSPYIIVCRYYELAGVIRSVTFCPMPIHLFIVADKQQTRRELQNYYQSTEFRIRNATQHKVR